MGHLVRSLDRRASGLSLPIKRAKPRQKTDGRYTADIVREALFLERIRSCAGHIVTSRQALIEFLLRESDEALRNPLQELLNAAGF